MSDQCNHGNRKCANIRQIGNQVLPLCLALLALLVISPGCAGTETATAGGSGDAPSASTSKHWYEDGITIIKKEEFETKVLGSDKPVVLEFFTPTCHACRMVAPIVEEMEKEYTGKVSFLKINAKANRDLSKKYKVEFTPVFIVFSDGKEQGRHEGHRFVKPIGAALERVMNF